MSSHRVVSIGLGICLLFGCNNQPSVVVATAEDGGVAQADVEPESPAAEEVARNYRALTLITHEPVAVDPYLATYCISAATFHEQAQKRSGPHAGAAVRIFMNESAAAAFRAGATTYPVGSVIVKEKQRLAAADGHQIAMPEGEGKPDGVGGMIKRARGYDLEHGDWEYFYFDDPALVDAGKIASCVDCHRAAAPDHVFGDWAGER